MTDAEICDRLRAGDMDWFHTADGRAAIDSLRKRLSLEQKDAVALAIGGRDMTSLYRTLEPVVCHPPRPASAYAYTGAAGDHQGKKDDKKWWVSIAVLVAVLLLLLLLWWWWASTHQNKDENAQPTPSPTVTETVPPPNPTYVVFFDTGSATLDDRDQQVIANAEKALKDTEGPNSLHIVGRSDGTGPQDVNKALAQARAQAVKDDIIADGFTDVKITMDTEVSPAATSNQNFRSTDIVIK